MKHSLYLLTFSLLCTIPTLAQDNPKPVQSPPNPTEQTLDSQTIHTKMSDARAAYTDKDFDTALSILLHLDSVVTDSALTTEINNSIGWTYFAMGNNESAASHLALSLEMAKAINDTTAARKASNNLGVVTYSMGDIAKAETLFNNEWSTGSQTSEKYIGLIVSQRSYIKKQKSSRSPRRKKRRSKGRR